jgi:hypothetical protein
VGILDEALGVPAGRGDEAAALSAFGVLGGELRYTSGILPTPVVSTWITSGIAEPSGTEARGWRALRSALRDVGPSSGEGRIEELALGPVEWGVLPQMEVSVSPRRPEPLRREELESVRAIGPGISMPLGMLRDIDKDREGAPPKVASSRPLPLSTTAYSGGEPRDRLERTVEVALGTSR